MNSEAIAKARIFATALEVENGVWECGDGFRFTGESLTILLAQALDEVEELKAELESTHQGWAQSLEDVDKLRTNNAVLALEVDRLREFIEEIYMNTSTSMPAAWNDELSWYQSQLHGVIGRAARFAAAWKVEK